MEDFGLNVSGINWGKMEGSVFPRESKFLYDAPRQEGKDLYCYESKLISNRCTGESRVEEGNKDG